MKGFAAKFVREPLVLFLVLGAAILTFDHIRGRLGHAAGDLQIEVTTGDIARMREIWIAQGGRPPTADELRILIDDHIREEILNREAWRLGLDRDDVIIRRRLAQKMTFLMEDRSAIGEPDEAAVRRFFESQPRKYERAATVTFEHLYFSRERRGDSAATGAQRALRELRKNGALGTSGRGLGDPFLLARAFAEQTRSEMAALFGEAFANALEGIALDQWSGPVVSAYGLHLVRVSRRQPAQLPAFAQIRDRVLDDYQANQRQNSNRTSYEALRHRYQVQVADGIGDREPVRPENSAR